MTRRLTFLLPVAVFAGLVAMFAIGLTHDPHLVPSALIDRPAPDFTLPGLYEGAEGLSRKDLDSGVTLVNFFASWCAPCREEHAQLIASAPPRSISAFTACPRLISSTAAATSVTAKSARSRQQILPRESCR